MKKTMKVKLILMLLIISSVLPTSCRSQDETSACFPHAVISVVLNLNLPAYQSLLNVGGWTYINEQSSGSRGLIVVRTSSGFMIYDRNAPHLCPDNRTTLSVVDNIKIVCPKDDAEWILLTGEPVKNAKVPPKRYFYTYNSGVLTIYN